MLTPLQTGNMHVIATSLHDSGSFHWTVPDNIQPGSGYRVKILVSGGKAPATSDVIAFSEAFIIAAPRGSLSTGTASHVHIEVIRQVTIGRTPEGYGFDTDGLFVSQVLLGMTIRR